MCTPASFPVITVQLDPPRSTRARRGKARNALPLHHPKTQESDTDSLVAYSIML